MKKLLTKILIGVLAVITMLGCFAGCSSSSSWTKPTLTSWKEGDIVGGFIGEKGDYVYFINGVGVSTEDNKFGAPVKGALMVADKSDLTKSEVVVPKLFVASDYKAGLYIYGDYVYYGSPNTEKNGSGDIANNELTFMRTKLDGTDTTTYFTLGTLSSEYRIIKNGESVYIVYYDANDTAIKAYNCNDKTVQTIVKTDDKVAGKNGESLGAYKFAENGSENIIYYVATVYNEEYNEDKTEARATASYNKLYSIKFVDGALKPSLIFDGSKDGEEPRLLPLKYDIKMVKMGVLFYSATKNGVATTYALGNDAMAIKNDTVLADTTLFAQSGLYTVTEGKIEKVDLYNKNLVQTVALDTGATTLLAEKDGYIYFIDGESGISRILIDGKGEAKIEKVSKDTVNNSWYPVQFIDNKLFYCDNSATGSSYISYVDVTSEVKAEDTDDDGENDKFYLDGQVVIGVMTEKDKIAVATAKVNAISSALENGVLPFEKDENGKLFVKEINEAEVAVKDLEIEETTLELLAKYQKAVVKANLYNELDGIFVDNNAKDFKTAYETVKGDIEKFRAEEDYAEISAYIGNNLLASYDRAKKLFEEE